MANQLHLVVAIFVHDVADPWTDCCMEAAITFKGHGSDPKLHFDIHRLTEAIHTTSTNNAWPVLHYLRDTAIKLLTITELVFNNSNRPNSRQIKRHVQSFIYVYMYLYMYVFMYSRQSS